MMLPEVKEIVQIPVVQLNATGDRLDGASPKGRHGNPKYFENGPKWARNGAEDPRKILEKGCKKGPSSMKIGPLDGDANGVSPEVRDRWECRSP